MTPTQLYSHPVIITNINYDQGDNITPAASAIISVNITSISNKSNFYFCANIHILKFVCAFLLYPQQLCLSYSCLKSNELILSICLITGLSA